jgi:hypothetical protein
LNKAKSLSDERRMNNDNLSSEKAEFFMGREGLCLTNDLGEDAHVFKYLIFYDSFS